MFVNFLHLEVTDENPSKYLEQRVEKLQKASMFIYLLFVKSTQKLAFCEIH